MTTPWRYPAGNLRVSDADRDRALAELTDAYQAGRLDSEEFDERSGRALKAKTGRELADLFTDLPQAAPPWPDPSTGLGQGGLGLPAQVPPPMPVTRPGFGAVATVVRAVTGALIVAVIFGAIAVNHHEGGHPWAGLVVPLLIVLFIIRRATRTRR